MRRSRKRADGTEILFLPLKPTEGLNGHPVVAADARLDPPTLRKEREGWGTPIPSGGIAGWLL